MTAQELRNKFNNEFGLNSWPKTFEVDFETYSNCCQDIFNSKLERDVVTVGDIRFIEIGLGPNNGMLFKGVELILKSYYA